MKCIIYQKFSTAASLFQVDEDKIYCIVACHLAEALERIENLFYLAIKG